MIGNLSISHADGITLGHRTLEGAHGHVRNETAIWRRLEKWAATDPLATYSLAELVARGTLTEDFPLLTFDMVAPTLRLCLNSGDAAVVTRCRRLVHDLGEYGFEEFQQLLEE